MKMAVKRYSVFQQGAGLVSAYYAIASQANNCANSNLDIAKDLNDEEHYSGPANINDDGSFYVEGLRARVCLGRKRSSSFAGDGMLVANFIRRLMTFMARYGNNRWYAVEN